MSAQLPPGAGAQDLRSLLATSLHRPLLHTLEYVLEICGSDNELAGMSLLCLAARLQVGASMQGCRSSLAVCMHRQAAVEPLRNVQMRTLINCCTNGVIANQVVHARGDVQVDQAQHAYSYAAAALLLADEVLFATKLQPDCFHNLLLQAGYFSNFLA